MNRFIFFFLLVVATLALAGCQSDSGVAVAVPANISPARAELGNDAAAAPSQVEAAQPGAEGPIPGHDSEPAVAAGAEPDETLVDEQGAVAVSVRPLAIDQDGSTLDFEVAMNTHSVDLSMDLAGLATLASDTGAQVAAAAWEAPLGGHHVSGVLSFPAASAGGRLLDGASTITLTLVDVDAPARTFTWSVK
jgi:hypothetical protein